MGVLIEPTRNTRERTMGRGARVSIEYCSQ